MNKLYKNELAFERANTQLTQLTSSLKAQGFRDNFALTLLCECANKACRDAVQISYNEYRRAKSRNTFVVCPEHVIAEFEDVITRSQDYWTLRKRPEKMNKPFEI